jgi:hypothetical protein
MLLRKEELLVFRPLRKHMIMARITPQFQMAFSFLKETSFYDFLIGKKGGGSPYTIAKTKKDGRRNGKSGSTQNFTSLCEI